MTSRVRMRFSKNGDLRWISHRDLIRMMERMFRRAGLKLAMTQGFHPRPKLTFPLALALGIAATDEVMEFALDEDVTPQALQARLAAVAPPGLVVGGIEIASMQSPKARVKSVELSISLPEERVEEVSLVAARIMAAQSVPVAREDGSTVDVRRQLQELHVRQGELCMTLTIEPSGGANAKDVLAALSLAELPLSGRHLTRTRVDLHS